MSSPTQRSLKYLRDDGWHADVVERWIPRANIRRDLFGIGDIVAIKSGERPLLVQTTTGTHLSERLDKVSNHEDLPLLLEHFRIILHGWRKVKVKRGGKAEVWQLREQEIMGVESV